jgi:environmental stress-induced protein Ves
MPVISVNGLSPVAWKNGGGITREIAQVTGPKGYAWRLSVADVESQGPFSKFDGFSRILTVIEGDGLQLSTSEKTHDVAYLAPFHFLGDVEIASKLQNGSIRDLNVIYDHDAVSADVAVVEGPAQFERRQTEASKMFVFGVVGPISVGDFRMEKDDLFNANSGSVPVELPAHSVVLVITITQKAC